MALSDDSRAAGFLCDGDTGINGRHLVLERVDFIGKHAGVAKFFLLSRVNCAKVTDRLGVGHRGVHSVEGTRVADHAVD